MKLTIWLARRDKKNALNASSVATQTGKSERSKGMQIDDNTGNSKEDQRMNSFPTTLNPWYVVVRRNFAIDAGGPIEYYSAEFEPEQTWITEPKKAAVYVSLSGAKRIADTEVDSMVIVLYSKERLKEYRRE